MSATNSTTNYALPIFIGTDKPAWLVDWNGAMTAIDAAIKGVDRDVQGAITSISGLSSTVASHTSSISTISGQITVITTNLNTATGNINTINSLIGNGTPTTTDQTLIGAINELHANQGDLADLTTPAVSLVAAINAISAGGAVAANAVSYDNTASGLTATNVQAAIDEIETSIDEIETSIDGIEAAIEWTLAGTQTGTTAVNVSSTAKEFYVVVSMPAGADASICVPLTLLKALGGNKYVGGSYYTGDYGNHAMIVYDDSNNTIALSAARVDSGDVTSTSTITVYQK